MRSSPSYRLHLSDPPEHPPILHPHVAFITPQMEERKLREESGRAYLDFPLNETIIYPEYRNNPAELAKIKRSIDLIKNDTNVVISHIDIHGYASPEAPTPTTSVWHGNGPGP